MNPDHKPALTEVGTPFFEAPASYLLRLPFAYLEELTLYFNKGVSPYSFLRAVLENDLQTAVLCNPPAMDVLVGIIELLREAAPADAWGTNYRVIQHLQKWHTEWVR